MADNITQLNMNNNAPFMTLRAAMGTSQATDPAVAWRALPNEPFPTRGREAVGELMGGGLNVNPLLQMEAGRLGFGEVKLADRLKWLVAASRCEESNTHFNVAIGLGILDGTSLIHWDRMSDWNSSKSTPAYLAKLDNAATKLRLDKKGTKPSGRHACGMEIANAVAEVIKSEEDLIMKPLDAKVEAARAAYFQAAAVAKRERVVLDSENGWIKLRHPKDRDWVVSVQEGANNKSAPPGTFGTRGDACSGGPTRARHCQRGGEGIPRKPGS
eukprot:GHVR01057952.1.p1 GENE.GHVR01057952.1~~GHVR01057952.1.p1  ORF type:complete len:271 (+),score=44.62 GHVR01057952.1:1411-2223(+)